jgi:ABC-type uncharacterized transport system YnjBCD permease subunit
MFPQMAVLAGLFEVIRFFGLFNSIWGLIFSYMIFTLPFTVWVLTTFMRELPVEIEEAAIVDGASAWIIVTRVFMPLMWPALVTTGLLAFIAAWNEFLFALTFTSGDRAAFGGEPVRDSLGHDHGSVGNRHPAARWVGSHLSTQDHIRPDLRRGQRVGRTVWQS